MLNKLLKDWSIVIIGCGNENLSERMVWVWIKSSQGIQIRIFTI